MLPLVLQGFVPNGWVVLFWGEPEHSRNLPLQTVGPKMASMSNRSKGTTNTYQNQNKLPSTVGEQMDVHQNRKTCQRLPGRKTYN